jgi:protein gp37
VSENTKIEWADHTFNPWEGCTKVGPGCDHCYAETRNNRFGGGNWGAGAPRRRTSEANWKLPLKWNRQAEAQGVRFRVFCASLADVFDNEVDPVWRLDLFKLIAQTPNLDWLLLTKRIGNAKNMLGDYQSVSLLPNIWLGITVVNQEEADRDIPKLLAFPARVRFLSMEPLLGPVDLSEWLNFYNTIAGTNTITNQRALSWVIAGGESGPGARPMEAEWVRGLRNQCNKAGVPFLFKQWGEWAPNWLNDGSGKTEGSEWMDKIGKKNAGRLLDGVEWTQFPKTDFIGW